MSQENGGFDLIEHARRVRAGKLFTPLDQAPGTYFRKHARSLARTMLDLVK